MSDGYALNDDGSLLFSEDSSIESCEYQFSTKVGTQLSVKETIVMSNVNDRMVTNSFQVNISFPYSLKTSEN